MRLNGQLQRGEQQQAAQHQLRQAHVPLLKKKKKNKNNKTKKKNPKTKTNPPQQIIPKAAT